jgi:hypothetical protein
MTVEKEFEVRITSLHPAAASYASNTMRNGKELSRLISAAVVSREFCNLLLADPAVALATGYNGEAFHLAIEEQELITSIRATSLADFAQQLTISRNGYSYSHNGRSGHSNGNGYNSHNGHSHNGHSNGVKRKGYGLE